MSRCRLPRASVGVVSPNEAFRFTIAKLQVDVVRNSEQDLWLTFYEVGLGSVSLPVAY
jgi:hypothetical protein